MLQDQIGSFLRLWKLTPRMSRLVTAKRSNSCLLECFFACPCRLPVSNVQARKAIDSAYVEATTNANCIGLVKLMGQGTEFREESAKLMAKSFREGQGGQGCASFAVGFVLG